MKNVYLIYEREPGDSDWTCCTEFGAFEDYNDAADKCKELETRSSPLLKYRVRTVDFNPKKNE